jgi:hypothetical protein
MTIGDGPTVPAIPFTENMDVQTALERAHGLVTSAGGKLSFSLQYYGPVLGYMVTAINGTADQAPQYWMLYVNDQPAQFGIDSIVLDPGDNVHWKYEPYHEATHRGTVLQAKHEASLRAKRS